MPLDLEHHLLISLLLRAVGILLHVMDPSHHDISVEQFAFGAFVLANFVLRFYKRLHCLWGCSFSQAVYLFVAGCTKDQWFAVAGRDVFQDYSSMCHVN
jgi:hypothetical protein